MPATHIRPADPHDVPLILRFIHDLAEYEREPEAVEATESMLMDTLFCAEPRVHGVIAELDGEAAGFAVFFFNYSTWMGRHGLYLEDLYVDPAKRGTGVGKALLRHLAKIAVAQGCGRYEWNVLDWNQPAIDFYKTFGAVAMTEWTGYRLTGQALKDFAAGKD